MKLIAAGVFAMFMVIQLGGCARQTASVSPSFNGTGSRPTGSGFKSPNQVSPCCKALAEGRIGLDQCMENPACKANNRTCCMQAIQ